MFNWFSKESEVESAGLQKMRTEFGQMLDAGRHVFDTAANAFIGGTDPEVIRKDLFATDKRINRAERQIRREIVVHISVHGITEFASCLVLMSIVKDAERVGDYGKNLFDLAESMPHPPTGEQKESLVALKDRISHLMASCREVFDLLEDEAAKRLICEAKEIEDLCDDQIRLFIEKPDQGEVEMAPTYVLAYRYFKRVSSHIRNVASSVVQPVDKIDFTSKITANNEENFENDDSP